MNANTTSAEQQLLALYDRISDSPDSIPRLRRLVLDLAVRGKLVEQNPDDEPASELLERIAAEKARLLEAGKIRKKVAQEPKMVAPAYELPTSWRWVPLGSIAYYDAGTKRESSSLDQSRWLLELEDVEKETGHLLNRLTVADRAPKSTKSEFQTGDILYGKLRPYLTKVLVADEPGYSTTEIVSVRPFIDMCPEYFALSLRRPEFVEYVTRLGQGTKMPRLRTEDAVVSPFPLPPFAEQHRIVAKVEELMALLGRLEATRTVAESNRDRLTAASLNRLTAPDATPESFPDHAHFALDALPDLTIRTDQIQSLRQTILNLAVRGKLVEQNPADEPAPELLKRIAEAKTETKRETRDARIKLAPNPEVDALPIVLPTSWSVQSFENLFLFIDYRGKTPPKTTCGVPLITAKNVRMGKLNREPREYIAEHTFQTWMTRGCPKFGDLFFTTEAPLANICLNDITENFALAQRVICLQPYGETNTRYMMFAIMSDVIQDLIIEYSTGLTAKGIKSAKLKPLPLPVPPIAEQHRIVAKVDELMALCDRLEAALTTANTAKQRLLEALLYEALAGDANNREAA